MVMGATGRPLSQGQTWNRLRLLRPTQPPSPTLPRPQLLPAPLHCRPPHPLSHRYNRYSAPFSLDALHLPLWSYLLHG